MNDPEILELNALCNGLIEGALSDEQKRRLDSLLAGSDEARRFYVRAMALSASLFDYAAEMQADAPSAPAARATLPFPIARIVGPALALAAAVALALWIPPKFAPRTEPGSAETVGEETVARLTASKDCKWIGNTPLVGEWFNAGQKLQLAEGFAEITFDCGAQVVLEGPASLDLHSAWSALFHHGALTAKVPPEAIGFRIENPAVQIVDLGTEFSMLAEKNGAAEVFVIEGSVEASGRDALNQPSKTITLKEKQARRFALHGDGEVADRDQKLARLNRKVEFQRGLGKTDYTHWGFDEASGAIARGRSVGFAPGGFDATFEPALPQPLVAGRWGNALSFDGAFSARAALPPKSPGGTRTAAFWCKIPADAALSESEAIVSWYSAETGERPVSIAWNGDPTLGALGALKTSLGRGLKVGSTPLRDGRWHHVAVVFAPNPDAPARTHLKTYLDGRLEATSFVRGAVKNWKKAGVADARFVAEGGLWIGRNPFQGPQPNGFRGELDELYLINRALSPREIQHLLRKNRLPSAEMLVAQ
jgi:ferric-dicitrate binding protein FerR (iron transport regulator)